MSRSRFRTPSVLLTTFLFLAAAALAAASRPATAQELRYPGQVTSAESAADLQQPSDLIDRIGDEVVQTAQIEPLGDVRASARPLPAGPGISMLDLPDASIDKGRMPTNSFQQAADEGKIGMASDDRQIEWNMVEYNWQASGLYHRPAYFEDVMLERHGHTAPCPLQPVYSGTRFFASTVLLPYNVMITPYSRHVSTLGHYRAGSYAPPLWQHPPLRLPASAYEVGIGAGLFLLIP